MKAAKRLWAGAGALLMAGALMAGSTTTASAELPLIDLTLDEVLAIAQVDAPQEGVGLQLHMDFPAEAPFSVDGVPLHSLTVDITPQGEVVMRNVQPAAASTGKSSDGPGGECSDPSFAPTGPTWAAEDMPIQWKMNTRSIPDGVNVWKAKIAARRAHQVWPRIQTDCNAPETNNFHFDFTGKTAKGVKYDGTNTVDFGSLGNGALALNYTWFADGRIIEVDLRLNKSEYKWTAKPGARFAYQIMNVVTHELGHQIGLDDLGDPHGELTMFGRIGKGEMGKITLGRGDMKGAAVLSP